MSDQEQTNNIANKMGVIIGELAGVLITLGVTGLGVFFFWNYALHQLVDVGWMKYYQSFLFVIGWRCLTYQANK